MMYGMGVNKLSDQLDVSVDEAKALTQQYHKRVPFVKGLMKGVQKKLEDPGHPVVCVPCAVGNAALTFGSLTRLKCIKPCPAKKPSRPTGQRPDYDGPTPTKP